MERKNDGKMPSMDVLFKRGAEEKLYGQNRVHSKSQHTRVDASPLIATTQHQSNAELSEGLLTEQSRFAVTNSQRRGRSGTSGVKGN